MLSCFLNTFTRVSCESDCFTRVGKGSNRHQKSQIDYVACSRSIVPAFAYVDQNPKGELRHSDHFVVSACLDLKSTSVHLEGQTHSREYNPKPQLFAWQPESPQDANVFLRRTALDGNYSCS
jgi:hypothetical protein